MLKMGKVRLFTLFGSEMNSFRLKSGAK
jgi:hypothetical protein